MEQLPNKDKKDVKENNYKFYEVDAFGNLQDKVCFWSLEKVNLLNSVAFYRAKKERVRSNGRQKKRYFIILL